MSIAVTLHSPIARRFPAQPGGPIEFSNVVTHVLRVKASEVPGGIPTDANPREANLNRQVYRQVRASLLGEQGTGTFHLKHGGIVLIAESVEQVNGDSYRVTFADDSKHGIANGGHSYALILDAQKSAEIPEDQFVEFKIHVGVPSESAADLADGLNTSMQVRAESLADLRGHFNWLKEALTVVPSGVDNISWHEGDTGEYDVREVIALLMSLDPTRYPIDNPVGIENTYARVSNVFNAYRTVEGRARVEGFAAIAPEAMALYEYIRSTAVDVSSSLTFRKTLLSEKRKDGKPFSFNYLIGKTGKPETSDVRLVKAASIAIFAAFRTLVDVDSDGKASWRYPFTDVLATWDANGDEMLREFYDALVNQFNRNLHYAGRSSLAFRASTRTLEVADLRRRLAESK